MNWLDWLIVAALALSAFQGLRSGLVSSVAKLAGILLGFGLGLTYYRDLAGYLNNQWRLEDKIMPLTGKILEFFFPVKLTSAPALYAGPAASPAAPLDPYGMLNTYGEYLARSFTAVIINAICFLALIALTVWAVNMAGHILTRIADVSFLGPLNHIGGLFFGGVKGIIIVMIFLTVISPFQRADLQPGNPAQTPGGKSSSGNGAFSDSKMLPYFVPLFNAIDRPLQGLPPLNTDGNNPLKSV
ncbi:CvpA family protein [Pelotomaculum propionicicum]|uniref:CvpA family protein n=1 Tax=Pelotomaculum propionicicum TaxID=258475 RepID=UPI003B7E85CF